MLRSFNDNYDLLRYITNAINTIKIWLEILKTEIKSISLYSMPSVFMLTAFSLREEGGGRNIRKRTKIQDLNDVVAIVIVFLKKV